MIKEILFAGFGGQGIMLMGKLLAYGAILEGLDVTFYPSYGPEMRGGTANCTVVLADKRIGSPIKNSYEIVMAMNQISVDKFASRVRPGGWIIFNQSMVDDLPQRDRIHASGIPATQIATDMGVPQAANMVALGGILPILEIVSIESLCKGLIKALPEHPKNLISLNEQAIRQGFAALRIFLDTKKEKSRD